MEIFKDPNVLPCDFNIDHYRIKRCVGVSLHTNTYKCIEETSEYPVIIKEHFPRELIARSTENPKIITRKSAEKAYEYASNKFSRKAITLNRLIHPGVVPVLNVIERDNVMYYIMRELSGDSAENTFRTIPTEITVRDLLQQLLSALSYVHSHDILHGNISPSNIHINPNSTATLIGFAPYNVCSPITHTIDMAATSAYAPIESINLQIDKQGKWSDLYSLAASFYMLMTGQEPMSAKERMCESIPRADLFCNNPQLKERFTPELLQSLDKAFAVDPNDRWQSAQEWLDALSAPPTAHDKEQRKGMFRRLWEWIYV